MDVRVVKLISGELVVGEFFKTGDFEDSPKYLKNCEEFKLTNPCILAYGPQGSGLVPMIPWVNPKEASSVLSFAGKSVMAELCHTDGPHHAGLIDNYRQIVSKIVLDQAGAGNIVSGNFRQF